MERSGKEKLHVKMFGGFRAAYANEVLTFGKQTNSKYGQLFQLLMTRPGKGYSKQYIMESLYGQETVEDANASLNNTIFRLRRYLEGSPLPKENYLTILGGVLRFEEKVSVESDVWEFELLAEQLKKEKDEQKRVELCKRACTLYQGEFLPKLSNETWVINKSHYYKKCYSNILRFLLGKLKEAREYQLIEKLSAYAASIHPFEEWEIWQIESLVSRGRQRDAMLLYQKTEERLHDLGEMPSEGWLKNFRAMGNKLCMPDGKMEDVVRYLTGDEMPQGAYYCNILSFLDYFRILRRIRGRRDVQFCGLICTIVRTGGYAGESREGCEKQGEKLEEVFQMILRIGDVYTKYNASQYLLLCVGPERRDIARIAARIDIDFQKKCSGRYRIESQELNEKRI